MVNSSPSCFNHRYGVKCVVLNLCNHNTFQLSIQVMDEVSKQIVSHGAWRRQLFNLDGDGVSLGDADPDRHDRVRAHFLEDDDGHIG